jgi:hypothetical protein
MALQGLSVKCSGRGVHLSAPAVRFCLQRRVGEVLREHFPPAFHFPEQRLRFRVIPSQYCCHRSALLGCSCYWLASVSVRNKRKSNAVLRSRPDHLVDGQIAGKVGSSSQFNLMRNRLFKLASHYISLRGTFPYCHGSFPSYWSLLV